VNPADLYHVGLVVANIESAAAQLTAAAGETLSTFAYYFNPAGPHRDRRPGIVPRLARLPRSHQKE